jgi:hypothetical protein
MIGPEMSIPNAPDEELCFCGKPLHYTDPLVADFTRGLIKEHGPTVKVSVGGRIWDVQRHYIALHGIKASELADLGFPEVEGEPVAWAGLLLTEEDTVEPAPGPLEGAESDEALMMYQEASEALRARTDTSPASPMRSVLPAGARAEGFRAVGQSQYSDVPFVLPIDKKGQPVPEGVATYEEAQRLGDEMLNGENWDQYQVEKFFYKRAE